ncbi:G-protein coupled receptor Mth2 isoform X1 [Anabrus simplex]|uniref:G-protein coupled receptor Mth2 isoform X1 n=1 Tax=Anabrus simplex TaxID=316456 RepID=UPI0035A2F800
MMERIYIFFALLVRVTSTMGQIDHNKSLLIRKCCPEGEHLNVRFSHCVPNEGHYKSTDKLIKIQSVNSVSKNDNSGFPWWMDHAVLPLSSKTFKKVESFFANQPSDRYIEYDGRQPCELDESEIFLSNSDHYFLLDNGTLFYYPNKSSRNVGQFFPPTSYCTDGLDLGGNLTGFVYVLCPCNHVPCVQKCCSFNSILQVRKERGNNVASCARKDEVQNWKPDFYHNRTTKLPTDAMHVILQKKWPNCGVGRGPMVLNVSPANVLFYENGSVVVEKSGSGEPVPPEDYCVDMSVLEDATPVMNMIVCVDWEVTNVLDDDAMFYGSLFVIGAVFLVGTLLVFSMLSELRTLHGNVIIAQTASLLPSYVFLAVGQLTLRIPRKLCISLAFIIQFSFLAAFFWLNVMCIDISWAFSGFRPPQGSVSERDRKKFIYYSLYAWGSPTIILIVTAVMEFVESIPDTYLKPNFGVKACWFKEKSASFAYFYGPMAALLLVNFILFIYTTVKIIQVQRDTRILHNGESGRHDGSNFKKDKKRLILYAKLFCLMGLTWITEIISVLYQDSPHYYWYVTDAINLLRAVFIFIIFCCKRKVFRLLKQRLFPSFGAENNASQSNGTRKSSSSTQNSILPPIPMNQLNRNGKVADKTTPENR